MTELAEMVGIYARKIMELERRLAEAERELATWKDCHGVAADRLAGAECAENRYNWIVHEPEGARHLLNLLREGKGNIESFGKMIDRIKASKDAARAGGEDIEDRVPGEVLSGWPDPRASTPAKEE